MIVKIRANELLILKSSLADGSLVLPDLIGLSVEEDSIYYYVSGGKAILFELLYRLSMDYDIELLQEVIMNYEINISLNGRHLFATHERSLTSDYDLKKVLTIFS